MGDVNIEVLDGGLGLDPTTGDEISVVMGTCQSGADESIVATRNIANLVSARGDGPSVEQAATIIKQTGKTVLHVKVATGTAGANSAVDSAGATGTSVHTLTGTPRDSYRGRFKWIKAGTRGVAGATFQYSLDDGNTWSPELAIGTAVTYVIPRTGLTINFAAGTFVAGDEHKWTSTEPLWADAGVQAGIVKLKESIQKFRLIALTGDLDAASAVTFAQELADLETAYRYVGLLGHARDFATADVNEAGWTAAISADFASFANPRVSVTAGHYLVTSPISGRKYRRPLAFVAAARLMGRPIQEHAGRVRTGALKGIESSDTDGLIYHDERNDPGLDAARFFTARTRIGRPGWFVERPRMMSAPGSDYEIWPHRSVIDKASDLTYEVLVDELNDDLEVDKTTGRIVEKAARAIESRLKSTFRTKMVANRNCSAVFATINRDTNIISTKKLEAAIRVVPRAYAEDIEATIGFVNPALELG